MTPDADRARDALYTIPPDLDRDSWVKAGMAAHAAGLGFDDFDQWSAGASSYDARACRETWRSFKPGKGVGPGTLMHLAKQHGGMTTQTRPVSKAAKPAHIPSVNAQAVWSRCEPATPQHPYVVSKTAQGVPLDSLRVVPAGDPLRIAGESMAGALVLPVMRDGHIRSLQFITVGATADRLTAKGRPTKLNLPGVSIDGFFTVGDLQAGGTVAVCEGIGTAWAAWQATGNPAVVAFGWGRVARVAADLREHDQTARLVLCPDAGKEADAFRIAETVGAAVAAMPENWPQNSDLNDLAQAEGYDVVGALLDAATEPPAAPLGLGTIFADELPDEFEAPDELVQGLLTAGAGSMLYGDSNSGKTFFAIDLACAVARGVPWMGRKTEQGMVVYVAAESPASVKSRLQAYQVHHQCRVPNFAIVQTPLDLFSGEADTNALIALVRSVERMRGQKVRLIVGDTLARLSAGANENTAEDMGLVVKRFDRVRTECDAHFLMIHHCGKAAAAGARGWSGIRAAMDTEIEVTDAPAGRCAEVTKQRDLSTKGERIGFTLERVEIGFTKWGEPASTCVVRPMDAPEKAKKQKRMGEVEAAALEFLSARKVGVKKGDVVSHFDGRYQKGPVYRALKALVEAGAAHEAAGMVCIAGAAK